MDVRASLNMEDNQSVITGDGQMSFLENDSFYAKAPPLAASTVGRTKSRRNIPMSEMGSFLEDTPVRAPDVEDYKAHIQLSFSAVELGARPKVSNGAYSRSEANLGPDSGDDPPGYTNGTDWSVVNAWCRENKQDDMSDQDGKSSLGIINVDEMDLSSNNLLIESPRVNLARQNTQMNASGQGSKSQNSTLKGLVSVDSNPWHAEGSSLKEQGSADSNPWRLEGSSTNNSQDSKPDQPFARSQLGTVKKMTSAPVKNDPIVTAIRQSLFGRGAVIEENEDGEASVYQVELEAEDLQDLDADFEEINCSVAMDSDVENSPEKTPTNKGTAYSEEPRLDSVYLRPGTTGEEQTTKLPYLSKVSLFDGGSGSEIDTEDELELARKAQGERHEAAGEDSDTHTRPGLEGLSLTDESRNQLPITQRQSADGNVITSPVPGDGGGGGDGSSGSDSEDVGSSADLSDRGRSSYTTSQPSQSLDKQGQRIRPMGDDLLSDLRFSRFASTSGGPADGDVQLSSRYLTPISPVDDTNQTGFSIDDFLTSQNVPLDHDFDPGNRLEASGFNADDVSALIKGQDSNPFDVKSSSFGSFGLNNTGNSGKGPEEDMFSVEIVQGGRTSEKSQDSDARWTELDVSTRTSHESRTSSQGRQTSLGQRSAASGSPTRDQRYQAAGSPSSSMTGLLSQQLGTSMSNIQAGTSGDKRKDLTSYRPDSSSLPQNVSKSQQKDSEMFRKPTLPAPKAANFSKSMVKSKQSLSRSSSSDGSKKSTTSSKSGQSGFDLEFRTSLSGGVEAQQEGLRRVPSYGGTSMMDLTVNDEDFFGNADAVAMLDADEAEFEQEHVIRQDDAMVDTGSPEDSWAYKSIMTVARPSWLEGPEDEEEVCVRISVGTFMRGRTEALGSLSGDGSDPRPDFGMSVLSPPKRSGPPARLIEEEEEESVFESTRSSGVGQYGNRTPVRTKSEKEEDRTLTMDSLLKTPVTPSPLAVSDLDLDQLGVKNMDFTAGTGDSTKLSMGEISMMLKAADTKASHFLNMHAAKSRTKLGLNSGSVTATQPSRNSPTKASQLPVRKGSGLSRSFPKVTDSDNSVLRGMTRQKTSSTDSGFRSGSLQDINKTLTELEKQADNTSAQNVSPQTSSHSILSEDVWSSPNTSSHCPSSSGLMEKLDRFKFRDSAESFKRELSEKLRDTYKIKNTALKTDQSEFLKYDNFAQRDREKTPPPDGQMNKDMKTSMNIRGVTPQLNRKAYDSFRSDKMDVKTNDSSHIEAIRSMSRDSPVHDKRLLDADMEWSRLDGSAIDHGYMPGHHIPDGTEYSQRSDYAHINHKGELREDVAGLDDVGLVESRGFNVLKHKDQKSHELGAKDRVLKNEQSKSANVTDTSDKQSVVNSVSKNRLSANLQPTQSKSPLIRATGSGHSTRNETATQAYSEAEDLRNVETQTNQNSIKLESWTQTSVVLGQSESTQADEIGHADHSVQNVGQKDGNYENNQKTYEVSGIPPQLPISSFKHDLLPNGQSAVPDRPNLLTNQSLMQTDFAQENLKRDFSVKVMDRIYSRNSTVNPDNFKTLIATSADSYLPGRESLESNTDWQYLQGRETLDTQGGDLPRLSDVHTIYTDYSMFERQASAQSTPYPQFEQMFDRFHGHLGRTIDNHSTVMATPSKMQSQLSSGTPAPATVCPVQAPGVLKFAEVCCVGISKKELLPLKNPTDRWMECILQVKSLEIDGRQANSGSSPFNFRQNKIIIDPGKTEAIHVMFLPKCAGAYVAHIQVFSHSFVKKGDVIRDAIPVNVTLQAIAEDPCIAVNEKAVDVCEKPGVIDYGEIVWGSCREKTICIRNNGLATVPLRLAIMSDKGWHCFSFEPEGRESDVSIISGRQPPSSSHGRSIMNLSLPGSNQPFNYHEVKVLCRTPDKQCTKALSRQPPEIFSCKIDVEVDIPSCTFPKLSTLTLRATVGVCKLHIQSNLKEIHLTCAPKKTQQTSFKVYNAGNLSLNAAFGFTEHKPLFSVSPTSLSLRPGVDAELNVAFMPSEMSPSKASTLLLMFVQPDGPMFELAIQGEIKQEAKRTPKLLCDQTKVDFGGVPIGKTCVKRYRLINKDSQAVKMCASVRADNILLARSADPNSVGSKSLDLFLPAEEVVPVFVLYSPVATSVADGRVVMKPVSSAEALKFSILMAGYGGVSRLCCSEESTTAVSVRGFPCIGIQSFSLGKVKAVTVHNLGVRTALVKVAVFKDLDCEDRMLSGQVVVQPSEFEIGPDHQQKLEIVVSMTESEFLAHADSQGVGAALCLTYQDKVDSPKPYRSQLVVGLVKGVQPRVYDDVTRTPSVSTRSSNFTSKLSQEFRSSDFHHLTDRSDSMSLSSDRGRVDNSTSWSVKPEQLTLYCSSRGPGEDRYFCIQNNNINGVIRFEIGWPKQMLSVCPCEGIVRAKDNMYIRISPTNQVSDCLDKLPWFGNVVVTCDDVMKGLRVEIQKENTKEDTTPEPDDRSLVPISTNIPHSLSGNNRLGDLQVSRTLVQFLPTKAGKMTEETLELTNFGSETFRWMFSSFASPYLRKNDDNGKELFRVSYKVFDFSRQFGKLAGNGTVQLSLQFMPRSTGTFSQYWDLRTSGSSKTESSSSRQDYIRIHLTGEGQEDAEKMGKNRPALDVENLLPRPSKESTKLRLAREVLEFPAAKAGESLTMKIDMKNSHLEEVEVEVTAPKPPFYMKHPRFKVAKKRYIKLPVEFRPSRSGTFNDTVKFQSAKGENLILKVIGHCL